MKNHLNAEYWYRQSAPLRNFFCLGKSSKSIQKTKINTKVRVCVCVYAYEGASGNTFWTATASILTMRQQQQYQSTHGVYRLPLTPKHNSRVTQPSASWCVPSKLFCSQFPIYSAAVSITLKFRRVHNRDNCHNIYTKRKVSSIFFNKKRALRVWTEQRKKIEKLRNTRLDVENIANVCARKNCEKFVNRLA